jgi:hypothetical protein
MNKASNYAFHKHNILNSLFAIIKSFLEFFNKNGGFGESDFPLPEIAKPVTKKKNKK